MAAPLLRFLPAAVGTVRGAASRFITRAPKPKPDVKPKAPVAAKPPKAGAKPPTTTKPSKPGVKPPAKTPVKPRPPIKKIVPPLLVPPAILLPKLIGPDEAVAAGRPPLDSDGDGIPDVIDATPYGEGGGGGGKGKKPPKNKPPKKKPAPPGKGGEKPAGAGSNPSVSTGGGSPFSVAGGAGSGGGGVPSSVAVARQQYDADRAAAAANRYANEAAIREMFSQGIMGARGMAADIYGGRAPALLGQAVTGTQRDFLVNMSAEEMRNQAALEALRRSYSEAVGTAYENLGNTALDRANERAALAAQINRLGMG